MLLPAQMPYEYPSRDRRCEHHRQREGAEYDDVKPDRVRAPDQPSQGSACDKEPDDSLADSSPSLSVRV